MVKYIEKISLKEARTRMRALEKTATVTDRVFPLPCHFEDDGLVMSYVIADGVLNIKYNHTARRESTRVVGTLIALDERSLDEAKFLFRASYEPKNLLSTEERHNW